MSTSHKKNIMKTAPNLLDEFLELLAKNFNSHSVVLFQQSAGNNHSVLVNYYSESIGIIPESVIVEGKGLVGWILKNKEALIYHVVKPNLPNLGYYATQTEDKIKSFMGIPLADGYVLCLDSFEENFYSDTKLELLKVFAKFIPQFVDMVAQTVAAYKMEKYFSLFEQFSDLKKNYSGWSSYLNKFLQILSIGTGFEYVAFASLSGKKGYYIVEDELPKFLENKEFSVNGGIVGWVFRNNVIVQSDGKSNKAKMPIFGNIKNFPDFVSSACIPIQIDKSTVAVVVLASTAHKEISNEFKLFTRLVSEDLAQFLEIVSLRYRIRKEKQSNEI